MVGGPRLRLLQPGPSLTVVDGTRSSSTAFGDFLRDVRLENAERHGAGVPSVRARPLEWRRLFSGVTPVAGESLRGLVCRACTMNHLPNSWGLLQYLGLPHRNRVLVAESSDIDPAELAYAIRVPAHEACARRYDDLGNGHVSFFGLDVHAGRIDKRVRRFSPAALRERAHHRATWELRDVPFCLEGWDMLQERCWCRSRGVVQGWTRTSSAVDECDDCGDPLAWVEPFRVPHDMRPALGILAALIDPSSEVRAGVAARLPEAIRDADRSRMFRLVIGMANGVDPHAADHSIEEPRARLHGLWSACRALMRWPTGMDDLVWHEDLAPTTVRRMLKDWIALPPVNAPVSAQLRPTAAKKTAEAVGIRRATEIAGLSPEVLLAAWDHGLLARHRRKHGVRIMAAFDPVELAAFGDAWRRRVPPDTVAHDRLGISRHGVEQLAMIGELVAEGPAIPGTGPHFLPETIDAYVAWFTDPHAWSDFEDAVPLVDVMRRISRRAKPWGPVLRMLRDGTVPFTLSPGERVVRRLLIPEDNARRIVASTFDRSAYETPGMPSPFADRMIQRDALELLNAGVKGTAAQIGIAPIGRNPRTYDVAEIERLAAEIVMIPEISALTGEDGPTIRRRLIRENAVPLRPGVWSRDEVGSSNNTSMQSMSML